MAHQLPKLPYEYSALEPHIDTRTLAIHHDKHHQAYVSKLNQALEGYKELQDTSTIQLLADLDSLPQEIRTSVRNNGGGHYCHSLFWRCMSPRGGGQPGSRLGEAIEASFGTFASFQARFAKVAASVFGSGWTWLCLNGEGGLAITGTPGHDVPLAQGLAPLMVLDVWEHAYYIKYENRRTDYIAAWWNVVDWEHVASNLAALQVEHGLVKAADWAAGAWAAVEQQWDKLIGA